MGCACSNTSIVVPQRTDVLSNGNKPSPDISRENLDKPKMEHSAPINLVKIEIGKTRIPFVLGQNENGGVSFKDLTSKEVIGGESAKEKTPQHQKPQSILNPTMLKALQDSKQFEKNSKKLLPTKSKLSMVDHQILLQDQTPKGPESLMGFRTKSQKVIRKNVKLNGGETTRRGDSSCKSGGGILEAKRKKVKTERETTPKNLFENRINSPPKEQAKEFRKSELGMNNSVSIDKSIKKGNGSPSVSSCSLEINKHPSLTSIKGGDSIGKRRSKESLVEGNDKKKQQTVNNETISLSKTLQKSQKNCSNASNGQRTINEEKHHVIDRSMSMYGVEEYFEQLNRKKEHFQKGFVSKNINILAGLNADDGKLNDANKGREVVLRQRSKVRNDRHESFQEDRSSLRLSSATNLSYSEMELRERRRGERNEARGGSKSRHHKRIRRDDGGLRLRTVVEADEPRMSLIAAKIEDLNLLDLGLHNDTTLAPILKPNNNLTDSHMNSFTMNAGSIGKESAAALRDRMNSDQNRTAAFMEHGRLTSMEQNQIDGSTYTFAFQSSKPSPFKKISLKNILPSTFHPDVHDMQELASNTSSNPPLSFKAPPLLPPPEDGSKSSSIKLSKIN